MNETIFYKLGEEAASLEILKNKLINFNKAKESYWINKKRDENPNLSLNIVIPKLKESD